jgi:hypothetical protein
MSARPFPIRDDEDRRRAAVAVLHAPAGSVVTIRPEMRRDAQNRLWRAQCAELARELCIRGRRYTADEWADIMSGDLWGWVEVIDPLSGQTRVVRRSTTTASVAEMSDLIEATYANGVALGHVWTEHRPGDPAYDAAIRKRKEKEHGAEEGKDAA